MSTGDGKYQIDESLVPVPSKVRLAGAGEASKKCGGPLHHGGVYLTIDSFYGNVRRADGLASRCKDCEFYWERLNAGNHRERSRRWRERKNGKQLDRGKPGYNDRLREFAKSGVYEEPNADDAAERLRRFERGEVYRK